MSPVLQPTPYGQGAPTRPPHQIVEGNNWEPRAMVILNAAGSPTRGFPYVIVVSERWPVWPLSHPHPAPGLVLLLTFMSQDHSLSSMAHRPCASAGSPAREAEVTDVKSLGWELALALLGRGGSATGGLQGWLLNSSPHVVNSHQCQAPFLTFLSSGHLTFKCFRAGGHEACIRTRISELYLRGHSAYEGVLCCVRRCTEQVWGTWGHAALISSSQERKPVPPSLS